MMNINRVAADISWEGGLTHLHGLGAQRSARKYTGSLNSQAKRCDNLSEGKTGEDPEGTHMIWSEFEINSGLRNIWNIHMAVENQSF
jgi:hypothetical protein